MSILSRVFGRSGPARPSARATFQTATWPFDQAPNAVSVTTRQVLDGEKEIHVAVHYSDDHSWAFLCGTTDEQEDGRVITMDRALEIDDTLRTIADLPPGWKAWRESRGAAWQKAENFERG